MQLRNDMTNTQLDIKIFGEHAARVLDITLIAEGCFKVMMNGIQFKVKLGRFVGLEKIKTQKAIYNVGQFNSVLDKHFLTELELIEKAIKSVDWTYHFISDGKAHKAAKHNFNHVKEMVENATDKKAALTIWNNYKN